MDSRHNVGTNPWNEAAVPVVPVVRSGTLPRGDKPVLRPRLNWEGGAAWNDQNWYHAGSSELGL